MIILGIRFELPVIALAWFLFPIIQILFILIGNIFIIQQREPYFLLLHVLATTLLNCSIVLDSLIWTAFLDEFSSLLSIITNVIFLVSFEVSLLLFIIIDLKTEKYEITKET